MAIVHFDGESIQNTYGIFDEGETGSASRYIHACELCFFFAQGPHTDMTHMSILSISPCRVRLVRLPGLAPSHFVFLALQTLHAMLILRRFGLGPL